jgi:predicted site-specific integrase-resolvase
MRLIDWARKQGITYRTAWNWHKAGKMPARTLVSPTGMILVEETNIFKEQDKKAWIYCRVSSREKKDDLTRQVERCESFCAIRGWEVIKTYKEIASGMNDNRPMLKKLLTLKPSRIVVEHKDRLTRFGFGYLELLLPMLGCDLVVINRDKDDQSDLMKDLISIITSFCCRLYGLRRGKNKVAVIQKELK